MSLMF